MDYQGDVTVLAHSLGNVVVGEAFQLGVEPIRNYVAAQAAISAGFYDCLIPPYWSGYDTPNIFSRYTTGIWPDQPYLSNNEYSVWCTFNYWNASDYALNLWEEGNEYKHLQNANHQYWEGDALVDTYLPEDYDLFCKYEFSQNIPLTLPEDRYVIFSYINQSRTRALGTYGSLDGFGFEADNQNLAEFGYNDSQYSHGREFFSTIVDERLFWERFIQDTYLYLK